ncbi:MAG: hypothetical protein HC836_32980 [Richelia sp. RM2_1_2]|nr:hypothetical protein [Richelia sp. RM2_1_2]
MSIRKTNPNEYRLAEKIVHLQNALETANNVLNKNGMLGVLPDHSVSFWKGKKFHKEVREILKDL